MLAKSSVINLIMQRRDAIPKPPVWCMIVSFHSLSVRIERELPLAFEYGAST